MSTQRLRARLNRLTDFAGGPPRLPFLVIERRVVQRDKDGQLWSRPYRRCVIGGPTKMLAGDWQRWDEPDKDTT